MSPIWLDELSAGFRWWSFCLIAALAALPLALRLLRALPDRGGGAAVMVGLAGVEFLAWFLALEWAGPLPRASLFRGFLLAVAAGGFIAASLRLRVLNRRWPMGVPFPVRARLFFLPTLIAVLGAVHLPHGAAAIWLAVLALAAGSFTAWMGEWGELRRNLKVCLVPFIIGQLLFLAAFAWFAWVRTYLPEATFNPAVGGAEKFSNLMHLNSMMRAGALPPADAWFMGEPTNYYYGGHLFVATIAKATGIDSGHAFNFGLATIFGLTVSLGYSLVFNLTARRARRVVLPRLFLKLIWHRGAAWGLLGAFAIACFGNLDAWQQILSAPTTYAEYDLRRELEEKFKDDFEGDEALLARAVQAEMNRPGRVLFSSQNLSQIDYWRSSRVIHGAPPGITEPGTITEFPYFSAILGDLHPHHLALPFTLLVLHAMLALFRQHTRQARSARQWLARRVPTLVLLGLSAGAVFTVNIWDAIVLAPLGLIAVTIPLWREPWVKPAIYSILIAAAPAIIILLPFKLFFHPPLQPVRDVENAPRALITIGGNKLLSVLPSQLTTALTDYFVHWGLFLVPIVILLGIRCFRMTRGAKEGRAFAAISGLIALLCLGRVMLVSWTGPVALCLMLLSFICAVRTTCQREQAAWAFAATAFFFHWFVEAFYFDDNYTDYFERYNTLFKLYYPLWPMLAAAAVFSLQCALRSAHRRIASVKAITPAGYLFLVAYFLVIPWLLKVCGLVTLANVLLIVGLLALAAGAILLLINDDRRSVQLVEILAYKSPACLLIALFFTIGMLYPVAATLNRTGRFMRDGEGSLDAIAYLQHEPRLEGDADAIAWLAKNAKPGEQLLEMPPSFAPDAEAWMRPSYSPVGRFSAATGIPSVVGWAHHELQWRGWETSVPTELAFRFRPYLRLSELNLDRAVRIVFPGGMSEQEQGALKALAMMPRDRAKAEMKRLLPELTNDEAEALGRILSDDNAGRIGYYQFMNMIIGHVNRIYSTPSMTSEVESLLELYAPNYIVVGSLERARYGASGGLDKFALYERVYESPTTVIYRVPSTGGGSND